MANPFEGVSGQLNGSVYDMVPVTPADGSDNLGTGNIAIGLYVTTGGAVSFHNNDGVTNNGAQVGIVTFKVPFNAPNTLYYQCQNHAPMVGVMIIDSDGNTGISSGGTLVGSTSTIDFVSSSGEGVEAIVTAGVATVTFTPGISIGLAIALGS